MAPQKSMGILRTLHGVLLVALVAPATGIAQLPNAPSTSHAQQIPFSTAEHGNVSTQQSAGPVPGPSVNTIQSQTVLSGRYGGSVADPSAQSGELSLGLNEAIERGLRYNMAGVTADNSQTLVRGQRLSALSALLPTINANLSETVTQSYLPALGLTSNVLQLPGGLGLPTVTGQYHYYTAQGSVSENAFDLTALHNLRSAEASEKAAKLDAKNARELVVLGVGGAYLQAVALQAVIESQRQQVALADASYKQAVAQQSAGTRAKIDANRSLVELRTEQERLTSDEAELAKQKIRLERLIGISSAVTLNLRDSLPSQSEPAEPLEELIRRAMIQRNDLSSAAEGVKAAEQALKASQSEYIPTVGVNGSYGVQGTNFDVGRVSYNGVASLNIPIWQGGRVRADMAQARATLEQRRSEYTDLRAQVEADIRMIYIDVDVAARQEQVANENRALARDTLQQSQDRFVAGVTDSVEVVQSQESLASAERDFIASLYTQSLARLRLAQATGESEKNFHSLLQGAK